MKTENLSSENITANGVNPLLAPVLSLSEGWVNFTRFPCKEGYIDRWLGDCINNPNSIEKSMLQLNSFTEYYRCNSGEWIPKHEFKRYFFHDMREEREFFTADEIFTAHRFLE
jgi:hypothetical protein